MPHWISLIVTYLAIAGAYVLIIRLGKKCTTTAPEDSPSKTEPSPTGPTRTISPADERFRRHIMMGMEYGKIVRELQDDTEFRSRYRGGLMPSHRPVSGFYSERSTDGGHSDER